MTEKELHRLSRGDLLRLLLAQSKDAASLKDEIAAIGEERDWARERIEKMSAELAEKDELLARLKEELEEKDAQLEKLTNRADEKADALSRDGAPIGNGTATDPIVPAEGMSAEMRQAFGSIERKLNALTQLVEKRDEENGHLWTVMDAMMDSLEGEPAGVCRKENE